MKRYYQTICTSCFMDDYYEIDIDSDTSEAEIILLIFTLHKDHRPSCTAKIESFQPYQIGLGDIMEQSLVGYNTYSIISEKEVEDEINHSRLRRSWFMDWVDAVSSFFRDYLVS